MNTGGNICIIYAAYKRDEVRGCTENTVQTGGSVYEKSSEA